jgi:hypothetical protein
MYATVRRYEGVTDPKEAAKRVKEGFVPLISKMPGFVEYYWVDLGGGAMISISVFESLSHAIESNQKAATWVKANLASVLPQTPRVEAGTVVAHKSK